MTKQFIALRAFIVNQENKVLLVREADSYKDGVNTGKYDVIGGRLDVGEVWRDGLLREIKEETGLEVLIDRPFYVDEWRPVVREQQWHIVGTFFVCFANTSAVKLSEDHDAYEWIDATNYTEWELMGVLPGAFEAFNRLNVSHPDS